MSDDLAVTSYDGLEKHILLIRGKKVMLGHDLALLYGVETKVLLQAVKRHILRFPPDFMFQLDDQEVALLRSQFVTSRWGGHRYKPYAFTEQGVAMLSGVLNSPRAVQANVEIMRAFVRMREAIETHRALAKKLEELEGKVGTHDEEIQLIFKALKRLMAEPEKKKKPIGFAAKEAKGRYKK
jgi:DNA-binding PadR family transcriptional regulator